MKKFLFLISLLICNSVAFAQVQMGKVMTPGRENKRSEAIPNVMIQLVGSHNVEKSGDDGTFSLALGNSAKNNVFQIGSVRKAGYTIFNKSTKFPKDYPVSNVPIEIVMIKTADLEREKQEWIDRGYDNAEKEYKKKLDALKKDYQKLKITEKEHNKRLNELEEWYTQYQTLIEPMAEYYVHVDFNKLDKELTEITKAIADGEYITADSLINVYAPNLDNDVEQSIKARKAIQEKKAYGESIIASALEDSIKQAQIDEHTASMLYAKYTTSVSLMRWDDALHNLKLRADLDTTNVDAVWHYAFFCYAQKKFKDCETYYLICLRAYIGDEDIPNTAAIQNNLGALYRDLHDYTSSEKYLKLALQNYEHLFAQDPDAYRADLAGTQDNLGSLYRKLHDYSSSEKFYKLALQNREQLFTQNPNAYRADLADTQHDLGTLYSDLHEYTNSEKYYKLALENREKLFAQNPDAYRADLAMTQLALGCLYYYLHDYTNSEKYYKLALEKYGQLFAQNPDAYRTYLAMTQNNLGSLYRKLHDYSSSEKYYKLALQNKEQLFAQNPDAYRPDLALTYINMMWLYAEMNNLEEEYKYLNLALDSYTLLYRAQPSVYIDDVIEVQNNKVWRLLEEQNVDEAITLAQETYALDESNKLSKNYLAVCYGSKAYQHAHLSEFDNAHNAIDKAISIAYDKGAFYDSKGEIYLMQGKNDEALTMWKKVIELNPNFLNDYPEGTNLSNGLKKLGLIE